MKKYSPEDLKLWAQFAANSLNFHRPLTWNHELNEYENQAIHSGKYADAMMEQLELRRSCPRCNDKGEYWFKQKGTLGTGQVVIDDCHLVKCPCQHKEGDK